MNNPPNNGTPPTPGAPAPTPAPDSPYQRLRALRGSEPAAVDIPRRRQSDNPE